MITNLLTGGALTKALAIAVGVLVLASLSMGLLLKSSWEKSVLLEERAEAAEANTKDLIDGIREANKRIQRVNDQKLDLQRERNEAFLKIRKTTKERDKSFSDLLDVEDKLAKEEAKKKGTVYVRTKNYCDTRGLN